MPIRSLEASIRAAPDWDRPTDGRRATPRCHRRHKTRVSLEDYFWACLRQIARERATTSSELIDMLDAERNSGNLSSTIRIFVLNHYHNNVVSNSILPANAEGRNLPARQPSRTGLLLKAQLIALTKNK
jgi:predicted DNA-binding ribbon-helix-helix protein